MQYELFERDDVCEDEVGNVIYDDIKTINNQLSKKDIKLVIKFLEEKTSNEERGELYKILGIKGPKTSKEAGKKSYKPGYIGEGIVKFWYEHCKSDSTFIPHPKGYKKINGKKLCPDGEIDNKYLAEVKVRLFESSGTADEKIPGIPWKYQWTCLEYNKKLIIFLLGDDEYRNKRFAQLINGDIAPANLYEEKLVELERLIVERVVLGSEIIKDLKKLI